MTYVISYYQLKIKNLVRHFMIDNLRDLLLQLKKLSILNRVELSFNLTFSLKRASLARILDSTYNRAKASLLTY